ncbi:hypothetical protein L6164_009525 [Bauhinia variegata]|uniref:Uncharacterized protein n=1 Tax=Bauhinia variegata TaxID=167791 RepID=A0ACB9PK06_BAUVA|nr:hypothetical protein L6164_009525 [Bauhinia variegata]
MKALTKLRYLHSNLRYQVSRSQVFYLSNASKASKLSRSERNQEISNKESETASFGALFKEITEILGDDNLIPDESLSGISVFQKTGELVLGAKDQSGCTQVVCRNAEESTLQENVTIQEDVLLENLSEDDVSRIVGEFTEIIRAENDSTPMEERLENLNYRLNPEIVGKVLKRCFKSPQLALRFFNWVKLKDTFCHTTGTYNIMLYMAGEATEFGLVKKLVEEMDKYSIKKDVNTWTILISQYGKAKQISEALMVFEDMKKCGCVPDAVAYRAVIRSLCTAGKGEIAMEFYKDMVMKDMALDVRLYKMLMNCMVRSGDIEAARSVANDLTRLSEIPENRVHGYLLKSFCISGRIKEALELIRDIKNKDFHLETEYFGTLVRGLCKADRIIDALEIVEIMKRRHMVDGKVLGNIINGYLRRNEVQKALDVFQNVKDSGHVPTVSTYTELIQHLFRLNQYEEGCKLYDEMLQKGIQPDSVAITAMVVGHISQNRMSEAWKLFKSVECQGIKPTWKSYSIFIKELCKVSRTDEIVELLYEMQASKIVIGDELFHWVITYLDKKGELFAKEKIQQMFTASKLDTIQCRESGKQVPVRMKVDADVRFDPTKSEKVDISSVQPQLKTFSEQDVQAVSRILSSSMDWSWIQEELEKSTIEFTPELVLEILHTCNMHGKVVLKFFLWVGKQTGYRHTTETYNMAIKIAGCGKDFKHMRNLFFEMRRNGYPITSETWTIMIMLYGRTGLTEMAMNCFREMKANGYLPSRSTYKYLIIAFCGRKGRKVDEAIKIYEEMICAGYAPDKELVEIYLGCLCEVGKLLDARRCSDSLQKFGYTLPLRYSFFVRALCRAGKVEEALTLVNEVGAEKSTLHQLTCGSLVHGLLRKGRLEEALAKVDSMKQAGITLSIHVYTSLIVHFFKEKQMGKAIETFKEMQRSGYEPTIVTYSALIRGYMNMGRVTDAWNIFYSLKIKGPFPDFKTYSMFLTSLCRVGRSEEALQLTSEMLESGIVPSTVNFRTVFYALNREGKQDLARVVLQKKSELMRKRKFTVS